jgi:hypothetical protein
MQIDPKLAAALMPFSPQVKRLAMQTVDRFINAINAGDEQAADAADNEIFQARGQYGAALNAILEVLNAPVAAL